MLQMRNEECAREIANLTERLDAVQQELADTQVKAERFERSWEQGQEELVDTRRTLTAQQQLLEDTLDQLSSNEETYLQEMDRMISMMQKTLEKVHRSGRDAEVSAVEQELLPRPK
jgi:chromosome segregation ATPase